MRGRRIPEVRAVPTVHPGRWPATPQGPNYTLSLAMSSLKTFPLIHKGVCR
jgi:hypothetical protein